jgi:NACalpha-BTF3-like transcription factor
VWRTPCRLHQAHFKLQRCQDRFASELGLTALKASAPAPASTAATGGAAAASGGSLVAAAIAAEAQEALAAAGEVPVPGVREVTSESEGDEMDEDSEEDEFADDGAGVPESAIVTVCEFTGLPRHTAIELLLVHGGDPAAVLAQMFP